MNVFDEYTSKFDLNDRLITLKYNHSYRVSQVSNILANSLGLDIEDVDLATTIGFIHDIGRFEQIKKSGEDISFEEVLKDIEKRDKEDREREHGAMIPAEDAIIVDNSCETLDETLDRCEKIILEKKNKE